MRFSSLIGAVLACAIALPAAAATDPVGGSWIVKGKVAFFSFTLNCKFDHQGGALSGTCYDAGTNKAHPLTSGGVVDDKVNWTYQSIYMLKPFEVTFLGALDVDGIKGSVGVPGHTGVFAATRP